MTHPQTKAKLTHMMRILPTLILLLYGCVFSLPAQLAPIGAPTITHFSRTDYQAGTQNWTIHQNERGLLYFGNNKGLLEFDGTNWQIYPLPNHTIVRSCYLDPRGYIYLGGQNELGYLQANERGEQTYTSLTSLLPPELRSFEDIWKIFRRGDALIFCSEKAIFTLTDGQFRILQPQSGRFENFFQWGNELYVQEKQRGLLQLRGEELVSRPGGQQFDEQRIVSLLPQTDTTALLLTVSDGFYRMTPTGIDAFPASASNFLKTHQAYCAIELTDGNYAIGTTQNGVLLTDREGRILRHVNQQKGLQNNTVLSLCQDAQQNLWLGLDNGIDYLEINSPFSVISSEAGIEGTGYAAIVDRERLYLGTNQGLFYCNWPLPQSGVDPVQFEPVPEGIGQVWSINRLDRSLILGQHRGASYIDGLDLRNFSSIQGAWKFMALESHPGYAVEGTYEGLVIYRDLNWDLPGTRAEWVLHQKLRGFNESARVFEQDSEGFLWVSHAYKGLYKIELTDDLRAIHRIDFYNSDYGLPDDLFINVCKTRQELVFTTPRGIYRYNRDQNNFTVHQDFNQLFGDKREIHRLIEDELGNIWFSVGSEFGVIEVQQRGVFNKLELTYFNQINDELVDGFEHVYAHDRSNVFIGTENGFIHYNPTQTKPTAFPFEALIRKVTSITAGDSILYRGRGNRDSTAYSPVFANAMNDFRFSYSIPYFEKINYLQYRYQLEGFDLDWSDWTPKTEKEYTNLLAGAYDFRVQARNAFGEQSPVASYAFTIQPPWYSSLYARFAYFACVALGLFGAVQYVSQREDRKTQAIKLAEAKKLESKEAEFKKEVEKSEGEIIKLRNEKLQADIKHRNSQLAALTMHLVQKSEILMKIKTDLKNIVPEVGTDLRRKVEQITKTIEADIQLDDNWEQFELYFDQVHENFFKRLRQRFPSLTPKDQKLCAYLRMNLTTKEIAPLLNISVRGVEISRYRLRKKLGLGSEENLVAFVLRV